MLLLNMYARRQLKGLLKHINCYKKFRTGAFKEHKLIFNALKTRKQSIRELLQLSRTSTHITEVVIEVFVDS